MHELVMPYVTVASRGGPHDDDAFVAGMVCGHLDAHMVTIAAVRAELTVFVPRDVLPQVDLIAMRHRYVATQRSTATRSPPWSRSGCVPSPASAATPEERIAK